MNNPTSPHTDIGIEAEVSTTCPFSGIDTGIERELDFELGPMTLDEFEIMVRNEWRRRLGALSYGRNQSRTVIRALYLHALDPQSPVRNTVVDRLIWWELVTLGKDGLSRSQIQREFRGLPNAVRQVLVVAGLDYERSSALAHQIAQKLRSTLEWPEPTSMAASEESWIKHS